MEVAQHLQNTPPSYIREILQAASRTEVISMAGGLPAADTFPKQILQQAFSLVGTRSELYQYGMTQGLESLLDTLHSYFSLPANWSGMLTTGSQQGLDLIARAYFNKDDCVVMEAPSYLGAMQVFNLCQVEVVAVEQTVSGPNLDQLEACFKQQKPKAFYTVPDFHNPTGVCWDLATRQRVADLCKRYNVLLIEDAPYRELRFSGDALPLLSEFCPEQSIVLRSFSKISAPGLRVGHISGKNTLIAPLIKVKQGADLHSSLPMQAAIEYLLCHPDFERHLQQTIGHYKECYQAFSQSLAHQVEKLNHPDCFFNPIEGGMFLWLNLPDCDEYQLANDLLALNVAVVPSNVFYPAGSENKSALRLNFTNASQDELDKALTIIFAEIKRHL